jgi:hypothetical protein
MSEIRPEGRKATGDVHVDGSVPHNSHILKGARHRALHEDTASLRLSHAQAPHASVPLRRRRRRSTTVQELLRNATEKPAA